MTIEQLREVYRAQPFCPFRLHLADGRSFEVPHTEFLALSRGGRTVIVFTEGESFEIIGLLLVSSLEFINGQPKRSRVRKSD